MTDHPYQYDPKFKHNRMTGRACDKLPLDTNGIETSINTEMMKTPHIILFHLEDLENWINTDIFTLKKDMGDIFSGCYNGIFKAKFLYYVNVLKFEKGKTSLKDKYLGVTTTTPLQIEVST